jgi:uncharacterized protein (DUF58 family)
MDDFRRYLDPKNLDKVAGLELKARLIVEGFLSGQQKSPYKGTSVEFREHREYVAGDDPRFLDWKLYAKSDRFYVKQYEEETNLKAYLILDTSKSMAYSSGGLSKLDYAKHVAAALTYLISQQRDAVALVLWDRELRKFLPPGTNAMHQKNIYTELTQAQPNGETDLGKLLRDLAERVRQRSMFVIFSDLIDANAEGVLRGLKHVRHKGHDVIVFHVLDDAEINFPFDRMTLFEGLEVEDKLLADPKALREAYLAEVGAFIQEVKSGCMANHMDYVQTNTKQNLGIALSTYLAARMGTH